MSLEKFMRSRLVVQTPTTRLYDAARALEDNHVGAILVHDGKALVGILTDRDLGLKAIGDDLDPFEFQLADVMSSPVATVSSGASLAEVAELMVDRHVRRVPIVDGGAVRGIVTLDDLILEQGVDAFTLAAIVRHQLAEPSRLKPAGAVHPVARGGSEQARAQRRAGHQRRAYAQLLRRALAKTQLSMTEQAEVALEVVLSGLIRRVNQTEAADLLAQLPSRLRDHAVASVASGPDVSVGRSSIEAELDRRLGLGPERAGAVLKGAIRALETSVDPGELGDLKSQLPADLKALFTQG